MTGKRLTFGVVSRTAIGLLALLIAVPIANAQAAASRFLGTISAISGTTLTVKPAQGDARQVEVPSSATLQRIEPGQTNLSAAVTMQFSDLAVGDRVLVNVDPNSTGAVPQALRVVAIKQADVTKKQQQDVEDWQKNGVDGLVKSIDVASGTIDLTRRVGGTQKTVIIHTTPTTVSKRYAPGSVRYDEAQAAPLSAIQPGDQLRARGTKNADETELTAVEIVSGSFRNISGTVVSTDPASSTIVVKDLATKKPVTVQIGQESQMKRLDDRTAQFLATRLKGNGQGGGGNGGGPPRPAGSAAGGSGAPAPQRGGGGGLEMVLERAQTIQVKDLQKGEAVMLVSTQGASNVTAIKLLAGVEPLLEAPASQDLLSNWSMSSSAPEAAQ
jgi:transcription antitermination factor NusG